MTTIKMMENILNFGNTSYSFFIVLILKICYNKRAKKGYDIMKKLALVTGSSRGIGKEIILSFAKEGYDVIITYLKEKELSEKLKFSGIVKIAPPSKFGLPSPPEHGI